MKRNSKIFGDQESAEKTKTLNIITKFPEKWVLIDTETGDFYQGSSNLEFKKYWEKIDNKVVFNKLIALIQKKKII